MEENGLAYLWLLIAKFTRLGASNRTPVRVVRPNTLLGSEVPSALLGVEAARHLTPSYDDLLGGLLPDHRHRVTPPHAPLSNLQ